jgi:hypothetical protein
MTKLTDKEAISHLPPWNRRKMRAPQNNYYSLHRMADLIEGRTETALAYIASPSGVHPGPWFHAEDWGPTGPIATGEALARAFDPYSFARREGYVVNGLTTKREPVPPLRSISMVDGAVVVGDVVKLVASPVSNALDKPPPPALDKPPPALDKPRFDKKAYQRDLMRARRAAKKAKRGK